MNTNSSFSLPPPTVFTQFIGTAKMLGLMLQTLNIGFVYYYGGLAPSQKVRALDTIKTKDDIKVMVSLFQCYPRRSSIFPTKIRLCVGFHSQERWPVAEPYRCQPSDHNRSMVE